MNNKKIGDKTKLHLVIWAAIFAAVLGIPLTVYALGLHNGEEIATSCSTKFAGNPAAIAQCINGGCGTLYPDSLAKYKSCKSNAKKKLKQLNAKKR